MAARALYLVTDGCGGQFRTDDEAEARAKFDESHMQHLYKLNDRGTYEQIG